MANDLNNVKILNHNHFIALSRRFDSLYNTRTYIGYASIRKILEWFPTSNDKSTLQFMLHMRISQNIKLAFDNHYRKQFTSDNYITNGGAYELHFFNSLYRFLLDIREGKGLYGPMSISRFVNGTNVIHPGAHRLAMFDVYKDPLMYVLTDYNHRIDLTKEKSKRSKRLYHLEDTEYNWRRGRWMLRSMDYSGVFHRSTQQEKQYKDLIDTFNDSEEYSFHCPELADREYTYRDDKVYVNGLPVVEKIDAQWRVVCV